MGQTAQLAVQQTSQISHEALQSSLIFLIQIPSYLYPGGPGMNGFHPDLFIYTYGIYCQCKSWGIIQFFWDYPKEFLPIYAND